MIQYLTTNRLKVPDYQLYNRFCNNYNTTRKILLLYQSIISQASK